jgi:hypothetical protein
LKQFSGKSISIITVFVMFLCLFSGMQLDRINAAGSGTWSSPFSVSQAISNQTGAAYSVEGYVVGQPASQTSVVTSNFPNDYALALADSPNETNTSDMVFVQIPSAFRSSYGLQSNPDLMGQKLKVTGNLTDYFSHPGVKSTIAFEEVQGDSDPTDPGDPPAYEEYYDTAEGKTGSNLKSALHNIIDDHTTLSYSEV